MRQQTSAATETTSEGRTIIDYSGKTIYVGIDVHQKDYQVAKKIIVYRLILKTNKTFERL